MTKSHTMQWTREKFKIPKIIFVNDLIWSVFDSGCFFLDIQTVELIDWMNGHRWSSSNKNVQLTWSMKQKKNLTTKHVKVIKQRKIHEKRLQPSNSDFS